MNVTKTMFEEGLIADFERLGSHNPKQNAVAYLVYMELTEVERLLHVNYHYDSNLRMIYISVERTPSSPGKIFIPVPSTADLSFEEMQQFLDINTSEKKSVVLAFVAPDSTSVYYDITEGLAGVEKVPEESNIPSVLGDKV